MGGTQKHQRQSLPLPGSTGVDRNHAKTPYERRSPSIPTPKSVFHQPPTPADTPVTPAVLSPTAIDSCSAGNRGVTPPIRQRKRTRTNESVEAGPSSSAVGSTTPSTSRTRYCQPAVNGGNGSPHRSPTKKVRLQTGKEAFQSAISPPQQLHSRANIGAGTSLSGLFIRYILR